MYLYMKLYVKIVLNSSGSELFLDFRKFGIFFTFFLLSYGGGGEELNREIMMLSVQKNIIQWQWRDYGLIWVSNPSLALFSLYFISTKMY